MSAHAQIPVLMSVQEFLVWEPGDGRSWQLVDGVPEAMAPTNRTHGTLQAELARLMGDCLRQQGSPCTVVVAPGIIPHVQARHNVRIPDLAVTCSEYTIEEATLTDPVLVVEILSPSNKAETWSNIWTYTTIPSVREILVLDTVAIGAQVLRRGADATWPEEPEPVTAGELVLDSISFRAPLPDLYRNTRLRRQEGSSTGRM